jgi:4-hydroxy-tetrahydrodipicolinate synthase
MTGPRPPSWRERLGGEVIAAPLVPRGPSGRVLAEAVRAYARSLGDHGLRSFAVWAHTARGAWLSDDERSLILAAFRSVATDGVVIATVGASDSSRGRGAAAVEADAMRQAELAAAEGADLIMCFPPPEGDLPDGAAVVRYHRRIAEASGLPLVAFVLYPEGGGRSDSGDHLREVVALEHVVAVKIATLDSPVRFQDFTALVRAEAPEVVVLSGEDRFYGASLMWGAEAGLIGVAAARPELSLAVNRAWFARDYPAFIDASQRLDRFAAATFARPIPSYVERLLSVAAADGDLPQAGAHDVDGSRLGEADAAELRAKVGPR